MMTLLSVNDVFYSCTCLGLFSDVVTHISMSVHFPTCTIVRDSVMIILVISYNIHQNALNVFTSQ